MADITLVYVLLWFYLLVWTCHSQRTEARTFRAAVYEHAVFLPTNRKEAVSRETALAAMMKNLHAYKEQTETAAKQGADIIVFPEDGVYGMGFSWEGLTSYLEYIPDPRLARWSPCSEPHRFANTDVQHFLSCLAKNNYIYVVANIGDIQQCTYTSDQSSQDVTTNQSSPGVKTNQSSPDVATNQSSPDVTTNQSSPDDTTDHHLYRGDTVDHSCPEAGHYQYNTDVVYDPTGHLVVKYHKVNLFFEPQFSVPTETAPVIFDTPFGTFCTFTCFDILFYNPAMAAIELQEVGNIIFPAAWMDAMPLLSGIQFHSAFAAGLGINLLASNINFPVLNFHGSGIYTPDGAVEFYYGATGKLLIADVPIVRKSRLSYPNVTFHEDFPDPTFVARVFNDLFSFVPITDISGVVSVCHNRLCCRAEYSLLQTTADLLALGAFNGVHTHEGVYAIEVCVLLKCKSRDYGSCGEETFQSNTYVTYLKMEGNFSVPYVFPEVLLSANGTLALSPIHSWNYSSGTFVSNRGFDLPVLSTALFARVYDSDVSRTMIGRPSVVVVMVLALTSTKFTCI